MGFASAWDNPVHVRVFASQINVSFSLDSLFPLVSPAHTIFCDYKESAGTCRYHEELARSKIGA
ncbi:hypothetical protein EON65_30230 [archaeon]|nr:MAG: hypothetical protein EON65_30230 [archaeon]